MKEQKYFKYLAGVFFLACIFSAYLIYDHYKLMNGDDFKSFCNVNAFFDCDAVNGSRFSSFLGVPLAAYGLGYYLVGFVLSALAVSSAYSVREAAFILFPATVSSVLLSAGLFIVSVRYINAVCLFCLSLYALNFFSFALMFIIGKKYYFQFKVERQRVDPARMKWYLAMSVMIFGSVILISSQIRKSTQFNARDFEEKMLNAKIELTEGGSSPRLGSLKDDVALKLIEFSDFECPFCGKQSKELRRILREYKQEVQLIFKNYPLDISCNSVMKYPLHMTACLAARAAFCAHEEGKFEEFHHKLFDNQKLANHENLLKWAKELGLNEKSFEDCLSSAQARDAVANDIRVGQSLKLEGTPTFFINGRRFSGLVTAETIEWLLENQEKLKK